MSTHHQDTVCPKCGFEFAEEHFETYTPNYMFECRMCGYFKAIGEKTIEPDPELLEYAKDLVKRLSKEDQERLYEEWIDNDFDEPIAKVKLKFEKRRKKEALEHLMKATLDKFFHGM